MSDARLPLIRSYVRQGMPLAAIGQRLGISQKLVGLILRRARDEAAREPRAGWSHPDAALLEVVRVARAEIEAAEGFVRPQP